MLKKLLISFIGSGLMLILFSNSVHAATYTVTKTADTNDGICDADCSFREAVDASNNNSGFDEIDFAIPTSDSGYDGTNGYFTMSVATATSLTDNSGVFINGYSQANSSRNTTAFGSTINAVIKIYLHFTNGVGTPLTVTGSNNHLSGLAIDATQTGIIFLLSGSSNNWIEGNYFGVIPLGLTGLNGAGIQMQNGSSDNVIGTNGDGLGDTGERNLFMGNVTLNNGSIFLQNTGAVSNDLKVSGNYFGTDKTGRTCDAGLVVRNWVYLQAGTGHQIGSNLDGTSDGEEANIIACVNSDARAELRFGGVSGSTVQGNFIGTNPNGDNLATALANENGIQLRDAQNSNNVIKRNVIAYNTGFGIVNSATSPVGSGNTFSQNTIYGNTKLGISINNSNTTPLANDAGDIDTGINDLMNYPVINKVSIDGNSLIVNANLDFKDSEGPFTIEFFDNDSLDTSGNGEGKNYIGSATSSNTGNNIILTVPITGVTPTTASRITSTATNTNGSTSEFSAPPADTTLYIIPPTPGSSSSSSPNSGCGEPAGSGMPDLFEIRTTKNSATLYFAPPVMPYSNFYIAYSRTPNSWEYGTQYNQGYSGGVLQYTVNLLQPNTKYYFRIRSGNGCATGGWGNTMTANTTLSKSFTTFYKNFVSNTVLKTNINLTSNTSISVPKTKTIVPAQTIIPTPLPTLTQPPPLTQTQSGSKSRFCIIWWCF